MSYLLIVIIGSWSFGSYYLINGFWSDEIINKFITNSSLKSLIILSKYSLGGFYVFPEKKLLCTVSILQYYTGKFIDLFILGAIFDFVLKLKDNLQ
ncbi:hypothetical protein [Clostridium brassicae]|uniref:Uncharacterized protein n=1 Tax=Clostridium brassicae TaxID=2999072 RepID=A0ABT4DG39_9CLOT|nr:hypothetical protein [Clostridium brassicae]MCY6959989.1 hypothetical protein [Clostridium brassicae]